MEVMDTHPDWEAHCCGCGEFVGFGGTFRREPSTDYRTSCCNSAVTVRTV